LKFTDGLYEWETLVSNVVIFHFQTFVVEVIQFRNAFDAQGPAVPGIPPAEAVSRLQDFQQRYHLYDSKRKTLDSVSKLFGIPCKPFAELDKTGEVMPIRIFFV
jgi:hypothetical protein